MGNKSAYAVSVEIKIKNGLWDKLGVATMDCPDGLSPEVGDKIVCRLSSYGFSNQHVLATLLNETGQLLWEAYP